VGRLADDTTLTSQDLTTQGVGDTAIAAVAQDGARVVRALSAAVPSQDPMSGATTGGRATVTVRAPPERAPFARTLRPVAARGAGHPPAPRARSAREYGATIVLERQWR